MRSKQFGVLLHEDGRKILVSPCEGKRVFKRSQLLSMLQTTWVEKLPAVEFDEARGRWKPTGMVLVVSSQDRCGKKQKHNQEATEIACDHCQQQGFIRGKALWVYAGFLSKTR